MSAWLLPALGYLFAVGIVGISSKLALQHVGWPMLLLTTTAGYMILTIAVGVAGGFTWDSPLQKWIGPASLTGLLVAGSFPMLMIALSRGEASKVVPITAAYPAFTALLAVVFLGESYSLVRFLGTLLIVGGAVMVSLR